MATLHLTGPHEGEVTVERAHPVFFVSTVLAYARSERLAQVLTRRLDRPDRFLARVLALPADERDRILKLWKDTE